MCKDTAVYYNPDLGCIIDFFLSGVEKFLVWLGTWTHNLSILDLSQVPLTTRPWQTPNLNASAQSST